ncbi:GNAT family N-acetyltransferase [Bradyrhizobium uaiense]|uniref:GNAT family N-acetyltransferase n=1 Tax=Bradyrhizobium uaiense TaxID=2594946 RepID=A0A6P1BIQ4_9BRAD|nr:GNAT family N-acetyltransferase [Bradyrhizobium uaiense]
MSTTAPEITIRPLKPKDWASIERLFGPRGACGGCWCMYWRVEKGGQSWDALRGQQARRRFRSLVSTGRASGLLAFARRVPIGWVCVGPCEEFPRLRRVRALQRERPPGTWSIVCFYIQPKWRGFGLGTQLLEAARDFAFVRGAVCVEGYPANVNRGQKMPGPFVWTGVPAMFAAAGFRSIACKGSSRRLCISDPQRDTT